MSVYSITALLLVTHDWTPRDIGERICTTAPGHCGHNYATYKVVAVESAPGGRFLATCRRIVEEVAHFDGHVYTYDVFATESDLRPGTSILK